MRKKAAGCSKLTIEKDSYKTFHNGAAKQEYEISYEIQYGEDLVRLLFVKNPDKWFTKEEILGFLGKNRRKMTPGSLYNLLSKLKRLGLVESKRSGCAWYRLKEAKYESHPMGVYSFSARPRVYKLDFFDYLGSLGWEDVRRVHDVHLWSSLSNWGFVDGEWVDHPRSKYKNRLVLVNGFRVELRVYYQVGSFVCIVKCGNGPVAVGFEGLIGLYSMLNAARNRYCPGVPAVEEWIVKQWHYGKDTKGSMSGADFNLCFKDWFGELVRVYSRHDGKVRVERVENPNVKVSELLGEHGRVHQPARDIEISVDLTSLSRGRST